MMISNENHRFVTQRDDAALAEALEILVLDPELRCRLGKANQARAFSTYDESEMFLAYSRLLWANLRAPDPVTLAPHRQRVSPHV